MTFWKGLIANENDDDTMNEMEQCQDSQAPNLDNVVLEDVHDNVNVVSKNDRPTVNLSKPRLNAWDITTPNIQPPHVEWPINAKELEVLMPKAAFWELIKQVFKDETMWATKSFQQEKFTISKTTHPEIAKYWHARHNIFAPKKKDSGQKISSVYPPFVRLLIAEFVLKWKVDYSWENESGEKINLGVHPSVAAIGAANKEARDAKLQGSQNPSASKGKRKMSEVQMTGIPKKEKMGVNQDFFSNQKKFDNQRSQRKHRMMFLILIQESMMNARTQRTRIG